MENGTSVNSETIRRLALQVATSALNRVQHQYQDFADYPYHQRLHNAQENFIGVFPVLKRIIYYLFVGTILVMTSMATYGLFYLAAMPAHAATEQLIFDYSCRDISSRTLNVCSNNTDGDCQFSCSPTATLDIFAKHTGWEAFHPEVIPEARVRNRILKPRTPYFLEVVLQLPETTTNQMIGMFAIEVELQDKNHTLLARSLRSSRLPHESGWIEVVRKSICLLPLLIGAMAESRTVVIPAFRHFVESTNLPLQHLVVRLVSQGSSWQGDRPVEIVAGELRIGKELNKFQNTLKEWFWTCFIVGTLLIFMVQSLFVFVAHLSWSYWREILQRHRQDNVDLGDAPYFFDATPPQSAGVPLEEDDDDQWEAMPQDNQEAVPSTPEEPDLRQEHPA